MFTDAAADVDKADNADKMVLASFNATCEALACSLQPRLEELESLLRDLRLQEIPFEAHEALALTLKPLVDETCAATWWCVVP